MRFEDLPAADQRKIRAGRVAAGVIRPAGTGAPATAQRRPAAGRPPQAARVRCGRCGRLFGAYPAAEQHLDETHRAGRLELVL